MRPFRQISQETYRKRYHKAAAAERPQTANRDESRIERRADFLAEKYNLSPQLTLAWVREHPEQAKRPMLPSDLRALIEWARV